MPERLDTARLLSHIRRPWLRKVSVVESTPSTNDLLHEQGAAGAVESVAVFAETQTAGRGRFGRAWSSAACEGIWVSFLLRPSLPVAKWSRLTSMAAVATARAIESVAPVEVGVKWPNDLILSGKKAAGILVETGGHAVLGPYAVLGIGINVHQKSFPPGLEERSISIELAAGTSVDRTALAASLADQLGAGMLELEGGFSSIIGDLTRRSILLGREVEVMGQNGANERGIAESIDPEGFLLFRSADGSIRTLSAGEVSLKVPELQRPQR